MTEAHDPTEALAALGRWSSALVWSDIPEAIRRRAALILMDDMGAMLAARDEPELVALRARVAASAGRPEATVFDGGTDRLDRYSAALGNGSAADWAELDGGYRPVVCHAALYVLPALMAEAEASGARLDAMLTALVAGYETVARVAEAYPMPALAVHPHGGLATIGAAAAVARLRGHDGPTCAAAINTAATMVLPGPFQHAVDGALVRNVWPGHCAVNGLRAVDWVEIGITGTPSSLTEVLAGIFAAEPRPGRLTDGLGETWAMAAGYHKLHACCQYGHSTVEAILEAIGPHGAPAPDRIRAIHVETHDKGRRLSNPAPATTLAAKFSIQHIAAATLVHGAADALAFSAAALSDPQIAALRERVAVSAFAPEMPPPNDRPARVRLALADGRELVGECLSARGGADRPFTEAEIRDKARHALAPAYPAAPALLEAILSGEADPATRWRSLVAAMTDRSPRPSA